MLALARNKYSYSYTTPETEIHLILERDMKLMAPNNKAFLSSVAGRKGGKKPQNQKKQTIFWEALVYFAEQEYMT